MITKPSAVILADGGIDLPEEYAERYGIQVLPLMIHFGSETLRSGIDITAPEFYRRLRESAMDALPTTSQPSAGEYVEFYRKAAEAGLPILSYHLSAALSGSISSARTARDMLPGLDIRIVDTGTLSGAMGMQVLVAAEMAARGVPPQEIIAKTQAIGQAADTLYTCDTLEYLRKGGRIGRVAGYVGNLLGVRPIITVDKATGTYVTAGRTRSFRLAAGAMIEKVAETVKDGEALSCVILHGDCLGEAERMADNLRKRFNCVLLEITRVNPSLGVHVGPDTLGLAYFPGLLPITTAAASQKEDAS
ncbi:MAG TPA: DegV family protein [Symbiobacteriaceae bacterium]